MDDVIDEWRDASPGLDVTPIAIVLRLGRIRALMEERMGAVVGRHGLTLGDFSAIAAVRRLDGGPGVPQVRIMEELGLTSGTVSVRVDRLVRGGWATRGPDPHDRRGSLVALTPAGRAVFDAAAPDHLANERDMLAGLSPGARRELAGLLRELLSDLEATNA